MQDGKQAACWEEPEIVGNIGNFSAVAFVEDAFSEGGKILLLSNQHQRLIMKTIRLDIEYEGTGFAGWAKQPNLPSIEESLVNVLIPYF